MTFEKIQIGCVLNNFEMSDTIFSESLLGDYRNYRDPALDEDNAGDDVFIRTYLTFSFSPVKI